MSVTLLTSHEFILIVKETVPKNVCSIVVTLLVSQLEISSLKVGVETKRSFKFVTRVVHTQLKSAGI